ncbi:MAG: AAA family ATPase [Desulfatitalea sp.]|nr:AAA family ATPase [Desulfatitalea sp.]
MEYYTLLQLKREPFGNTPDPDAFFESRQHVGCLQKLELALRLRRGLNVVIGEVGTGKTTLCRELIRRLDADPQMEPHLILDPSFDDPAAFLHLLHQMLYGESTDTTTHGDVARVKERIKQALFAKGVEGRHTLVLIIDEGQKMSAAVAEMLRELLNFETNQFKLLQIVIFAQQELEGLLRSHPNFADRINLFYRLTPLGLAETRRMIRHRIKLASATAKPPTLFSGPALWAIHRATRGYPRRIIHLCHQCLLALIIQNRQRVGWRLVHACRKRMLPEATHWRKRLALALPVAVVAILVALLLPRLLSGPPRESLNAAFKVPATGQLAASAQSTAAVDVKEEAALPVPDRVDHPVGADTSAMSGMPTHAGDAPAADDEIPGRTGPDPARFSPASRMDPESPINLPVTPDLAAVESPQENSDVVRPEPPPLLGHVVVQPGDTLQGMVRAIYGSGATRYMRMVLAANPQISNPDVIELEDRIAFPTLPDTLVPAYRQGNWTVLAERDTLQAALRDLQEKKRTETAPLSLATHWAPDAGLRFTVVKDD